QGRQPRKKIVDQPLVRSPDCTIGQSAEGAAELADRLGERRHRSQAFVVGGDLLGRLLQGRAHAAKAIRSRGYGDDRRLRRRMLASFPGGGQARLGILGAATGGGQRGHRELGGQVRQLSTKFRN